MIRVMSEPLRFDVLSLFPESLNGFVDESIIGRAQGHGLIEVRSLDLRDWAEGKHRVTDDRPFGGGPGMVLKPEPIFNAVEELRKPETKVSAMVSSVTTSSSERSVFV